MYAQAQTNFSTMISRKSLLALFVGLSCFIGSALNDSFAEGTKQTTATSTDRTHLLTNFAEYNDFGRYNGNVDQRLFIHIQNPETEVVYFGFSQFYDQPHWPNTGNSRTGYFRIKDPNGNVVWPTAGNNAGQLNNAAIANWQQAVNGPNQIVGSGGYNAFTFNPDGLPAGDYYIEFSASQSTYNSADIIIPYYDITVATESPTPTAINGRVFSYNWAFMCPSINYPNDYFDRNFSGTLYIYSDDGFVSNIDFSQAQFQGAAFNIAFNSTGTANTGVFENDRASVENLNVTFAEYRVFLNNPDINSYPNGTFGEFVFNAEFPRLYGCPDDGQWFFRFAATQAGRVEILIDSNGNNNYDPGTADRLLSMDVVPFPGETPPYERDMPWDGLNGLGNPIPSNTTLSVEYSYSQGFYHLPVYDVEHLRVGLRVNSVRPVTPTPYNPRFFYDDEAIAETLPGGQPALQLNGCTPPCHYWTDYEYGNVNTINTFWYAYRSESTVSIPFETPPPTCAGCPFVPFEIIGSVFHDANQNGVQDNGELGYGNVTVNVYNDANGNGVYNPGTDPLIDTDNSLTNGEYSLVGNIATEHLIRLDLTDLPLTSVMTTPSQYNVEFFSLYDASCDNLFGFVVFPIANNDYDTIQNTAVPITVPVQANDIDPLGNGITTSIIGTPVNGGTAVLTGNSITYTAIPNYIGVDSVQYAICTSEGLCDTAWVVIQIGDICGDGIDNDGDGQVDNYSPQIVITATRTNPYCIGFSDGTTTSSATGGRPPYIITWYQNSNPIGSTANLSNLAAGSYTVQYEDQNGCKEIRTLVLTASNCPPIANNDFNNTLIDIPVSGNVLTNDFDLNGDNLIVTTTPVTNPAHGSVMLSSNGNYTYTPNAGFVGDDQFIYNVCDNGSPSLCDQATVYIEVITINNGNNPPLANADAAQTMVGVPVTGNVLVNDSDPDGDNIILTITPIVGPTNGSVVMQPNGSFTYTPNPGFIGTDYYTYNICDDGTPVLCDTAVVTINVLPDPGPGNDPPFAGDDAALTPMEVPVSGNLLVNDFDPNGDNIIINTNPITQPLHGTVVISSNGNYTYTPAAGYIGPDQFIYRICDDGTPVLCANATCHITVYPDNNPPVATDDMNSTLVGVPVSGNVTTNDWDPDGDDLTVTTTPLTGPSHGTVTLNPNGSYTYTPSPGFNGEDSFTYITCDNGAPSLCDTAEVSIEVIPISTANEPPVAQDDAAQTQVGVPVTSNVLGNDDDPDGDNIILNLTPVSGPSNGTVTLLGDGTFTYTPNPGFEGTDVFTYSICDDVIPSLCDTAEVTIVVIPDYNGPDNDPPFAGDDGALTPQNVPVSGQLLTNDYDVNGDNIIINTTQISGPTHGSVVINSNGTYTYTPNNGYTGPDQFVYEICDDGTPSLCAQATCYITVYADNNPPVAVNDFNNTLINTPVSGSVITNDTDPDGDQLTVNPVVVSGPSNGALSLLPNGNYTYTPNPGFTGEDTFVYTVCDNGIPQLCDNAVVTISVIPVTPGNDPPVANPDAYVTTQGVPVGGNILVNDDDPDGDLIILNTNPLTGPSNGSVTLALNGNIVYTPNPAFVGEDSFTYRICDNGSPVLCDETTVTIIVLPNYNGPDNDPPFAGDDAALTPMNVPVSGQLLTNDFDPNGDNIIINTNPVSGPAHGTVVINSNGTYTYTPATGYIGPDHYVYQICDNGTPSLCAQATCYITVFPGPGISWTTVSPLCNGQSNGSIDITVTNATAPLTYSWSNGATTQDLTNVPAGTYAVTVTDAQGSVLQSTIQLTQPAVLGVLVDVQDETIVNGCNGSATANPTGGTAPYSYLWSNGQTTQTATGLCAGIYQVTITDANGCTVTTSRVINPPSCDLDVLVTGTSVACNGGANGSATATPVTNQNNVPFTYLWSNGATTQQITAVAAGPYTVTVTDGIGCTASGTFVVTEPPLLTVSTTVVDEQTFGGCNGSATATAGGGTSPYLYSWSNGAIGQTASNICPGNYTVTITDARGCTVQRTITVNALSCTGFTVQVNTVSPLCFGQSNGSATAVVSGGTAPFTYFWTTGGSTASSLPAVGAGTFTVQVTDAVNCQQTASGVVTQPALLQAATAVDNVTCHGLANGAIELTVTGGTTPYGFTWSNGATTEDLNNLGPGTYGVSVVDANGCPVNRSAAVTEPDTLGASSINTNVTCFGGADGAIDLTATGGLPPYQYSWSNGQTTQDVSGLAQGNYSVTFVDQNACVYTYSTSITQAGQFVPTITASGPTTFCAGGQVVLTATAGNSYLWSNGATTQSITVSTSGVFSVNVVSTQGCFGNSATVQVTVNPNPNPSVNPIGSTTFCQGGSVTLSTGSYASYLWSTGATTQSITVNASGTYSVTVTNGNGCSGTSQGLPVTVNPLPTPTITAGGPTTFCQGSNVVLTASSGSSYLWSNGATTQSITLSTSGSFSVTVTDGNGCQGVSAPITTVRNPNPTPTITASGPTTFCSGGSVVLTASSASSYLWSTGATTQSITVSASGSYTVTVTDANGCSGTSSPRTVTVNPLPTPTVTANGPTTFCAGSSVVLTSSSATSYLWSTGATTQSITVSTTGSYSVTVTNANGCQATSAPVNVTANTNPAPTITANGPTEFCAGGTVQLTASSGSAYLWNTGATSATISVNTNGSFWVTVSDGNACSGISDTVDVVVNPNPTPVITPDGPLEFCNGDSVTLTASAASAYLWSNGATTQSTVVYTSGSYSVTVTDANGCSGASAPVTVVVNQLPFSFIFATGPVQFCEGDSVDLVARESAGYLWSNGDTTRIITVGTSGTYSVTNIDDNGCQASSNEITVTVFQNPALTLNANGPLTFCEGDNVVLSASVASPFSLQYSWNTGETTQVIVAADSGSYFVSVVDANGCTAMSDTVNVDTWDLPVPVIQTVGAPSFCVGDTITLTTTEMFEAYLWTNGDTTQTTFALTTGIYNVLVTDSNGCQGSSPDNLITVNQNPTPTTAPDGIVEICQGDTISITCVPAESYLWTTGDTTQVIYVSEPGIYNVMATDQNGCTGTSSDVTLIVNQLPVATIVADGDLDFCLGESVTLSTQDFDTYQWSTGAIGQSILVNTSGTYTVTVTDSTGCASVSAYVDVTVYQPPVVSISINGPQQFCFGDSTVLTATAGLSSYQWSNGATTQSITVYTSGSYNVTVTDQNGCQSTSPLVTISVYSLPNVDIIANGPTEFCQGGSVTLTATGGQNYVWSTGAVGNAITVSASGSYYVTGGNQFGCVDTSASVSVLVNNPPVVTIYADGPTTFCQGDSVGLVASGADSYQWNTNETGPAIVVNTSGTYSVVGTDANGCSTQTGGITVTVNPNPVPTITADGPSTFCDGGSVMLTSSLADSYLWSTGDVTQSIVVTLSGTFTVSIVDAQGCGGTSAPFTVEVLDNPNPVIAPDGPTAFCDGDSVTLSAPANFEAYLWSTGDTLESIVVYAAGNYSVTVTDEAGCEGTTPDVVITVYQNPVPQIAASDTVVCDGQTVTLTSSSAVSYEWSTGANGQQITVTVSDTYGVIVTDVNGCIGTDSINITVNPTPTPVPVITANGPTTFCDGDSVNLEVDPWDSYLWSTGDTTQNIWVDESGLYVVTVTNEFGCVADAAGVVVTVDPKPAPIITSTGDGMICAGETLTLSTDLYNTYSWSTGDTTQTIVIDTTGIYTVTVTNSFGCAGTSANFEVIQHALPEVSIDADGPTTICEGGEVTLSAIGNGPYLWSTGDTTQMITVSEAGTYFVQATDTVTGCTGVSDDVVVSYFPAFVPAITANGPTAFCSGDQVVLMVDEGVSFVWSTGDTTQSIIVDQTGVYSVTVIDQNGCSGTAAQTVTVLPAPIAEIIPDSPFPYCDGDVVTLTALFNLGATYEWSTGETGLQIEVTQSGVYSVTVTNFFGCSEVASLPIGFLPTPNAEITLDGPASICAGDVVTLTASGIPFGNTYLWSNGESTQSIDVSEAGSYSVTVTNFAGCSATSEPVVIDVIPGPTASIEAVDVVCVGDTVTLTASGGDNYVWSNGQTGASIVVIALDNLSYSVVVTNDGCDQSSTDQVNIVVQQYPVASFTHGDGNLGDPVFFTDASTIPPMFSWNWDFGDGNSSSLQNPSHNYEAAGDYSVTLTVSSSAGCTDDTTIVVPVEELFVITNVLTPNGDDVNDYMWITSSLAESIEAKIYNRWGLSVWEGVGTDLRFYGKTPAGQDLVAGTYYYIIILNYGDAGTKELTGYLTLIRD